MSVSIWQFNSLPTATFTAFNWGNILRQKPVKKRHPCLVPFNKLSQPWTFLRGCRNLKLWKKKETRANCSTAKHELALLVSFEAVHRKPNKTIFCASDVHIQSKKDSISCRPTRSTFVLFSGLRDLPFSCNTWHRVPFSGLGKLEKVHMVHASSAQIIKRVVSLPAGRDNPFVRWWYFGKSLLCCVGNVGNVVLDYHLDLLGKKFGFTATGRKCTQAAISETINYWCVARLTRAKRECRSTVTWKSFKKKLFPFVKPQSDQDCWIQENEILFVRCYQNTWFSHLDLHALHGCLYFFSFTNFHEVN